MDQKTDKIRFYDSAMRGIGGRRRNIIGLRMTPMVDIIFLLLTFFVLTAKFQDVEKNLKIFLPKNQAKVTVEQKPLAIHLTCQNGQTRIQIQNSPSTLLSEPPQNDELLLFTRALRSILSSSSYPAIEINCDDAIPWDHVVKVYDVVYALGGRNITFRYQE